MLQSLTEPRRVTQRRLANPSTYPSTVHTNQNLLARVSLLPFSRIVVALSQNVLVTATATITINVTAITKANANASVDYRLLAIARHALPVALILGPWSASIPREHTIQVLYGTIFSC